METIKEKINLIQPQGFALFEFMQEELITKGIKKEQKEIAVNMILDGVSNEKIVKYTKLSLEQIEIIRNDLAEIVEK